MQPADRSRECLPLEFEIEIEIDLTREELLADIQIDVLTKIAERMISVRGETPKQAILALLTAATVISIRNASPGMGVAPELKELMIEAMKIARSMTAPPPREV